MKAIVILLGFASVLADTHTVFAGVITYEFRTDAGESLAFLNFNKFPFATLPRRDDDGFVESLFITPIGAEILQLDPGKIISSQPPVIHGVFSDDGAGRILARAAVAPPSINQFAVIGYLPVQTSAGTLSLPLEIVWLSGFSSQGTIRSTMVNLSVVGASRTGVWHVVPEPSSAIAFSLISMLAVVVRRRV